MEAGSYVGGGVSPDLIAIGTVSASSIAICSFDAALKIIGVRVDTVKLRRRRDSQSVTQRCRDESESCRCTN